jgi:alpha-tubulin suppressor-like RCC1 family protein
MVDPCFCRLPLWPSALKVSWLLAGLAMMSVGCGQDVESPTGPRSTPELATAIGPLSFAQVSAGYRHTCGVTTAGKAYCWGENFDGELGDGTTDTHTRPVAVSGGLTFLAVSGGYRFTCGVTADFKAYCWGHNQYGKLGDGTTSRRLTPARVAGNLQFRQVSAGQFHACGVTPSDVAYCWGLISDGRLGIGSTFPDNYRTRPTLVAGQLTFMRVSAGANHSCGLRRSGKAFCWGDNRFGQLGDGTTIDRWTPRAIPTLLFNQVVAGARDRRSSTHTCGVTTENKAYCWGANDEGQLGNGTTDSKVQPRPVAGGLSFLGVDPSGDHSCGVTIAHQVYCWGWNYYGQLGNGESGVTAPSRLSPSRVSGSVQYATVSTGENHTCGVGTGGQAYCWGANNAGTLANGTSDPSSIPVAVVAPE